MNTTVQAIVNSAEIPSIPHVLQQILSVANDPNSSSQDLEKLIVQEPGLVAHLLKTVNSAYYAFSTKISSINHAIVLLGFSTVSGIASGLALIDAFNNMPGLNKKYVLKVWKHALTSAGLIKVLAGKMDKNTQDELFLAAMVQNVGHLILSQYFGNDYEKLIQEETFPSMEKELVLFGTHHAEAGALLLETWKFSPGIIELIGKHHTPEDAGDAERFLRIMGLCDRLAREGDALRVFMELEESELDPLFVEQLNSVDLSWDALQEQKEKLLQSVDLSNQIIS